MNKPEGATYRDAGVSFEKADSFLAAMLRWVARTEEIPGEGLRPLIPNGYYASVLDCGLDVGLALSTDGVGSKILVAEMVGDYTGIGIDCIAMNVNDLICVGARPLAMVDYLAIQDPPVEVGEQIGRSLYEGARQARISIPGGELAQLPEMIRGVKEGEGIDLAGAAIGLVPKDEISHGQGIQPGDVLVGIGSAGLHSNGFTLARHVLLKQAGLKLDQEVAELGCTLGEELVRPTVIYVPHLRALWDAALSPRAMMHITGGGLLNLLRASTENVTYVVDQAPDPLPIFALIQERGRISDEEMHRVFNMGVGMVLVVAPERLEDTLRTLKEVPDTPPVQVIGHVTKGDGKSVLVSGPGLCGRGERFEPMKR